MRSHCFEVDDEGEREMFSLLFVSFYGNLDDGMLLYLLALYAREGKFETKALDA